MNAVTLFILALCTVVSTFSQTVGVMVHDSARTQPGYTLFTPTFNTTTFLIDNNGQLLHSWPSVYASGLATMLMNDGAILRAGKNLPTPNGAIGGGVVEIIEWDGTVRWKFERKAFIGTRHHDLELMPNGNVLLTEFYVISKDSARALGRIDTSTTRDTSFFLERLIEVRPIGKDSGEIVWQWNLVDHLIQDVAPEKKNYGVIADHPELLDINGSRGYPDWLHVNSVRYNAERDEVLLSVRNTCEIMVIQRSTGRIVYRWGNPKVYGRGTTADQKLFDQHDARWIEAGVPGAGNITIFNNGVRRPNATYSTLDEIIPSLDANGNYALAEGKAFGPDTLVWQYKAPASDKYFSQVMGGWTRQPNGNALSCLSDPGKFFEVTNDGTVVWMYTSPVGRDRIFTQGQTPIGNPIFKINRYPADHPAFIGKSLTPQGTLESIALGVHEGSQGGKVAISYVPGSDNVIIRSKQTTFVHLNAYDVLGRWLGMFYQGEITSGTSEITVPRGTMYVRESED